MLTDTSYLISLTQEGNNFYIGLLVFVGVATLTLIIAFLGCCGALKESQCMLVSVSNPNYHFSFETLYLYLFFSFLQQFFCFLLIVLVAEIATGVYAYLHQDQLLKIVRGSVKYTVQHEFSVIDSKTSAFNTFQKHVSKRLAILNKIHHSLMLFFYPKL